MCLVVQGREVAKEWRGTPLPDYQTIHTDADFIMTWGGTHDIDADHVDAGPLLHAASQ
jgi:hypothetical protein